MRRFLLMLTVLALSISVVGLVGAAQTTQPATPNVIIYQCQYAVKVVQGVSEDGVTLGWGLFFTCVNIHNPWSCKYVRFRVKLAIAGEHGDPGPISDWRYPRQPLPPDRATEYDGADFNAMPPLPSYSFIDGYFIIQSEDELDVVGVYTGSGLNDPKAQLATMHLERVPAQRIEICVTPGI